MIDDLPKSKGCYLLHFEQPISPNHTCQHYLGFGKNLKARIEEQLECGWNASRLLRVAKERGINVRLVRIWSGYSRIDERKLKNIKNSPRLCPECNKEIKL